MNHRISLICSWCRFEKIATRQSWLHTCERGVIFEMTLLLLPAIILLIAIIINVGNLSAQRTLVQAASDAASHAGTIALDNTQEGWDRALQATKAMFQLYNGRITQMDAVDWSNPVNYVEYHGGGNDVVVIIERGSWDPDTGFVSYEEGSSGAPGWSSVAGFMAANAVRSRVSINSFANYFAQLLPNTGDSAIVFENIVINGKVQKTCVAPFAVPVCSLLSMEGGQLHFDKDLMCEKDRWVTQVDPIHLGYWTPDAFYDPAPTEIIDPGWDSSVIHTPNYVQTDDNFAVVGFPASHGPLTDAEVRRIINNGGPNSKPCVNAILGESFNVLAGGLTEQATDTAIWQQIKNPLLHPEMKVEFKDALKAPNSADPVFIQPNWVGLSPGQDWIDENCPSGSPCPPNAPQQPNPLDQKVCNSHRFEWSGCEQFGPTFPFLDWCDPRFYKPDFLDFTRPERRTVWQAKVPVIGDMNPASSCDSQLWPPNNHFINPAGVIKIIGFVTLNIYDVDIGYPKPHRSPLTTDYDVLLSDAKGSSFLHTQDGQPAWDPSQFSYTSPLTNVPPACDRYFLGNPVCGNLVSPIDVPETWIQNESRAEWEEPPGSGTLDPVIGWMYNNPPDLTPCNVVRTRIDCTTGFFQAPATSPEDEKARIVE